MTRPHPEIPRRGPHRERLRREPSAAIDPALPILRELEVLVRQAAASRTVPAGRPGPHSGSRPVAADHPDSEGVAVADHPDAVPGPDAGTTTVPSRSVRLSGTPASRTAEAVDGAGCP